MTVTATRFWDFTSVVMDKHEFDAFCDELHGLFNIGDSTEASDDMIAAVKNANHLPLMARGTKTQKFFDRWGITTDHLGVVVRGYGQQTIERLKDELKGAVRDHVERN